MKTIQLTCHYCNTLFIKSQSEYNRIKKSGREYFFCSKSCSITHSNIKNPRGNTNHFKGKRRDSDGLAAFRYFLRRVKGRTNFLNRMRRDLEPVNLDVFYLQSLWETQQGKCAITGLQLTMRSRYNNKHKPLEYQDHFTSASLDRIDSSKGYIKGNVQYVSNAINLMKLDVPDKEFREGLKSLLESYSRISSFQEPLEHELQL